MKKMIYFIVISFLSLGCKEETVSVTTTEIILGSSLIQSIEGQEVSITLSGGDGKRYSVWPESSLVADAKIIGDVLTVTSKSSGVQRFTIVSRGKRASLTVEVKSVPNLCKRVGVYTLDGEILVQYRSSLKQSQKGIYIMKSLSDPYASRMFLPLVDKTVNVGDTILYPIVSEGWGELFEDTGDGGRIYSVIVERLQDEYVQLKNEKLRIVTNVRE